MTNQQGHQALAERAYLDRPPIGPRPIPQTPVVRKAWEAWVDRILGDHGVFIPDVREHEPNAGVEGSVDCSCGWSEPHPIARYSWWDHIGAKA